MTADESTAQAPDEAVEKAARDEAERRYGLLGSSGEALRIGFVTGYLAALSAATPGADKGTRDPDDHGPGCGCAGCFLTYSRPSPGVVDLRPGLREAVEAFRDRIQNAGRVYGYAVAADLTDILASETSPGGDDARVVAAEQRLAEAEQNEATLRQAHAAMGALVGDVERERDEARRQVADLRARIEALADGWEKSGGKTWSVVSDLRAALAEGGQPDERPCPECGGLNGSHGMTHVRHGNGGGANLRCPRTDSPAGGAL